MLQMEILAAENGLHYYIITRKMVWPVNRYQNPREISPAGFTNAFKDV